DLWRDKAVLLSDMKRPGDEAEQLASTRRALEGYERLARRSPPVPQAQDSAGRIRMNLAIFQQHRRDDEAAVDVLRRAAGWLVPLVASYPGVPNSRMSLGQAYIVLSRSLLRLRRAAAAAEAADKAHRVWKELADHYPDTPGYKLGLASSEGR